MKLCEVHFVLYIVLSVAENVSLHHRVQNGSGAHPTFYQMGKRGYFPEGKAAGT